MILNENRKPDQEPNGEFQDGDSIEGIRGAIRRAREEEDRNPFSGGMSPVHSSDSGDPTDALFPIDEEPLPTDPDPDGAVEALTGTKTREPADVVDRYIRCWNAKAFGVEYDCFLSHRLGMSKETYADRRMAVWLGANKNEMTLTQQLGRMLVAQVKGAKAQVLCTRIQTEHGKRTVFLELYDLRQAGDEWRIYSVDTGVADDELMARQMAQVQG